MPFRACADRIRDAMFHGQATNSKDIQNAFVRLLPYSPDVLRDSYRYDLGPDVELVEKTACLQEEPLKGRVLGAIRCAREAAEASVHMNPIRACCERLGQDPDADAQHIRLMLQQVNGLSETQRYWDMRQSQPDIISKILSAAVHAKPGPENARPLVGEVIEALSTEALQGSLREHTQLTVDAAAMYLDVPSLGSVFNAAGRAGSPVCARVYEEVSRHGNVAIEQVLQRGSPHNIADLVIMACRADPDIGRGVLLRAADHSSDPLGRLRESGDHMLLSILHGAAESSGTTVESIDRRRELVASMRTRETPPSSPSSPWSEAGSRGTSAGAAPHFSKVNWSDQATTGRRDCWPDPAG